jgi:hypothetical protein
VQQVETAARALITQSALQRPDQPALSASAVSDIVHVNRVEGLALGAGLGRRLGGGFSVAGNARYGLDDHQAKGGVSVDWEGTSRTGWRVFASHDFRNAGDVQERSTAVNSLAAQEFASDDTDPYDALDAGIGVTWRTGESVVVNFETSFERERPLAVHARPVTGQFSPALLADPLHGVRALVRLERSLTPWTGGTSLAATAELRGMSGVGLGREGDGTFDSGRLFATAEVSRPFGSFSARSWTALGFEHGNPNHSAIPVQDALYLGGPVSGAGYGYHQFMGTAVLSERLEIHMPVPFPRISLSRFGATPSQATLVPFAQMVAGNFACRSPLATPCGARGMIGAPSLGLGLMPFYEAMRFDVAHGFRGNTWTFTVDVSREFWSIL